MNCPTCGAVMAGYPCLNHPEKTAWVCPKDRTHWEVTDKGKPMGLGRLDPKDQSAVLQEAGIDPREVTRELNMAREVAEDMETGPSGRHPSFMFWGYD